MLKPSSSEPIVLRQAFVLNRLRANLERAQLLFDFDWEIHWAEGFIEEFEEATYLQTHALVTVNPKRFGLKIGPTIFKSQMAPEVSSLALALLLSSRVHLSEICTRHKNGEYMQVTDDFDKAFASVDWWQTTRGFPGTPPPIYDVDFHDFSEWMQSKGVPDYANVSIEVRILGRSLRLLAQFELESWIEGELSPLSVRHAENVEVLAPFGFTFRVLGDL